MLLRGRVNCMVAQLASRRRRTLQVLFESQGRTKGKAVDLEDMKFHQCVRLARFENDRTISFIPPDGAFDLMCASASGSCLDCLQGVQWHLKFRPVVQAF